MKMNSLKSILFLVLCLFALLMPAQAQRLTYPFTYANHSATSLAVIVIGPDASPIKGGTARISFLNTTSDLVSAVCRFYRPGAPKVIANASSGTTNRVTFSGTTGNDFATSNQVCLLRRKSTTLTGADSWERMVSLTNTATSVTFTTASGGAVAVNDEVFICTLYAQPLVGANASKEWAYNFPFYNGEPNRPVLVETTSTTLAKIPLLTGWWE